MPFEFELRERLHQEASSVPLPGRDPRVAAHRSKSLRRHRRQIVAVGMVAVSAAVILGAPLLLANDDSDAKETNIAAADVLPAVGPIDLSWQTSENGLLWPVSTFQAADGTVYGLSTEPGPQDPEDYDGLSRVLYRMNDAGVWEPMDLGGDRSYVADVASGADGVLYSVSTAPAPHQDTETLRLSVSSDGGASWTDQEVEPAPPPSDEVEWMASTAVSVETIGSTALATVNTSFYSDFDELFPELDGPEGEQYGWTMDDRGVTLIRYGDMTDIARIGTSGGSVADELAAAVADELAAAVELVEPATTIPSEGQVDPSTTIPPEDRPDEEIRTVPWSDLGIDSQADLGSTRFFRQNGDGWDDLMVDVPGATSGLTVAGDQFVVRSWDSQSGGTSTLYTSTDGTSWNPVATPVEGDILSVGGALVLNPWGDDGGPASGRTIHYSTDAGASWSEIDLSQYGADPGSFISSASSGPLGLAIMLSPAAGDYAPDKLLVTGDLTDWTVTDLSDVSGHDDLVYGSVFVGADRVVVELTTNLPESESYAVVGTPIRD